jgi:hypothetical protein
VAEDTPKDDQPMSKVAPVPGKSRKTVAKAPDDKADKPKKLPPKSRVKEGGRITPKAGNRPATKKISRPTAGGPEASKRYTPPSPHYDDMPSPLWVPVLMFTMFGLGMLVIFLNYVELLPGATSNWYLLVGLGLILGGIITATQYR